LFFSLETLTHMQDKWTKREAVTVNNHFVFGFKKKTDGKKVLMVIYFFLPVATAADLVTLPDEAAFFSTSLMTPTATV